MKKILITGANSFVGTNVEKRLLKEPNKYYIETLDMRDPKWKEFNFSNFNIVFHVAGIAHVSTKKRMNDLYFEVNRDLAIETANKAKESGVEQFIFMSSMIIYGKDNKIGKYTHVNVNNYAPINAYGKSKLEADLEIQKLSNDKFHTTIIRCPVVYGENSKGNFLKLQKLALKLPIIPNIKNQRSMIHIDNLSEFVKLLIDDNKKGVFYPQNNDYMSTYEIMKKTRELHDKKVRSTKLFNWLIRLASFILPTIKKVYGNKTYDLELSKNIKKYIVVSNEESIALVSKK